MGNSPDAVNYYIPLMKYLNLTWSEIKRTPRYELMGLIAALSEYNILHSFDGYTEKDVSEMRKNNPSIMSQYGEYVDRKRKYSNRKEVQSFSEFK